MLRDASLSNLRLANVTVLTAASALMVWSLKTSQHMTKTALEIVEK